MHEGIPQFETGPERFPSKEELVSTFESILNGKEFTELRFNEDEKGVALYEIETNDEEGYRVEYNYQRAKYDHTDPSLPSTARFSASIHKTIYDGDMPVSGECVANYLNGTWEFTS